MVARNADNSHSTRVRLSGRILAAAGLLLLVVLAIGRTLWPNRDAPIDRPVAHEQQADAWPLTPWKNAHAGVKYVGDAACARCHADIAESFRRHPMGRSLAPIAEAPAVGNESP